MSRKNRGRNRSRRRQQIRQQDFEEVLDSLGANYRKPVEINMPISNNRKARRNRPKYYSSSVQLEPIAEEIFGGCYFQMKDLNDRLHTNDSE